MAFFKAYWRGEISLVTSYWLVGIAVGLLAVGSGHLAKYAALNFDLGGVGLFALYLGNWLLITSLVIWQAVGLWRSATRYHRDLGKPAIWAWLAKAATLLGAAEFAFIIVTLGLPQSRELFNVTILGDPNLPDYVLNLEEDGSELHISGGIKFGITKDVERVLAKNPTVKTITLTSQGGQIREAGRLYRLIRANGLNTVTNDQCLSACTVIFAAGTHRWLGGDARLGFHSGAFVGLTAAQIDEAQHDIFQAIIADDHVPASFFEHVAKVPAKEMWYPTRDELLANHYITEKRPGAASSRHAIEDLLMSAAVKQQAGLPQKYGEQTTLIEVRAEGASLLYVYEVTAPLDGYFLSPNFQLTVDTKIHGNACGKAEMKTAIELGVSYVYRYRSATTGRLLHEMAVTSCQ